VKFTAFIFHAIFLFYVTLPKTSLFLKKAGPASSNLPFQFSQRYRMRYREDAGVQHFFSRSVDVICTDTELPADPAPGRKIKTFYSINTEEKRFGDRSGSL
jgi:hypothetical protein